MGFHIQMRNKDGYIKKLMEIAIDIWKVALFVHGCSTRLPKNSKRKNQTKACPFFVSLENCNLH